ncbi:MAG: hypothetical protein LBI35_00080 [Burkholderiales bacterium]|jgi:hypothetical protein|nr:hypothetical protein [Burkholderiales bacterium]
MEAQNRFSNFFVYKVAAATRVNQWLQMLAPVASSLPRWCGAVRSVTWLVTGVLVAGLAGNAFAQLNVVTNTDFDCDSLYASGTNAVYRIDNPVASAAATQMYNSNVAQRPLSTIALGYRGGVDAQGNPSGPLTMYHWDWQDSANSVTVRLVESGAVTFAQNFNVPRVGTYYWAGGEVERRTGRIFFTGSDGATMGSNYIMMLHEPRQGGAFIRSGTNILPAVLGDAAGVNGQVVASDVALDAAGNAYLIVGGTTKWLIRVALGQDQSGWTYNKVVQITGLSADTDYRGMAFLDGALYVLRSNGVLYAIDVFTGAATQRAGTSPGAYDLASCQAIPVVQGTVYNDLSGMGDVKPEEAPGVAGITVDLYKNEGGAINYKGTRTTDSSGNYSFIVDSAAAIYYIRVRQPQIDGVNAAQTWAGVGGDYNVSTAFCVDDAGVTQEIADSGICRGVRWSGSDPATHDISFAQIYSKVEKTSDHEPAYADFGISVAASHGDAAAMLNGSNTNFEVLRANGGPFHVMASKELYLGDTISSQPDGTADPAADAHASDDGVFVVLNGVDVSLQNVALAHNKTYTLKAKTKGPFSHLGYLSAWDNAGPLFSVVQHAVDLQDVGTGEITFPYATQTTGASASFIARVRFSTTKGLPAQTALPGGGQQLVGSLDTAAPWVVDGEVEDYLVYQMSSLVRLAVVSVNGAGTFTYSMANISLSAGSTNTSSLTTAGSGVRVDEENHVFHAVSDVNQHVTVTQAPMLVGWETEDVECKDTITGALVPSSWSVDAGTGASGLIIAGTEIGDGSDITCLFTNEFHGARADNSYLLIDQAGPIYVDGTGSVYRYTMTVRTQDAYNQAVGNVDVELTVGGGLMAGTGTGAFDSGTGICTTDVSGECIVTWWSATPGTYEINATLVLQGLALNGSPAERMFVNPADVSQSLLTADKNTVTADNVDKAILTVELRDSTGQLTASVGDRTVTFSKGVSDPGAFSVATCIIPNGGSHCFVEITSTMTGTTNVTAEIDNVPVGVGSPQTITFVAGPVDLIQSTLTATPATLPADGASTSNIVVMLKDAYGNVITDPTVVDFASLSGVWGDGTLSAMTCTTDAGTGACSITYTSPYLLPCAAATCPVTVTASVPGVSGAMTADITLTDAGNRKVTVTKTVMGGAASGTFTVRVACSPASAQPTSLSLAHGEQDHVAVQDGSTCAVTEDNPGESVIGVGNSNLAAISPSSFAMDGEDLTVKITNRIETGRTITKATVKVTKVVSGDPADKAAGHDPNALFDISVLCGDPLVSMRQVDIELKEGQSATVEGEAGDVCVIDEAYTPTLDPVNYQYVWGIWPMEMTLRTVDEVVEVTVDNKVIPYDPRGFYAVTLKNEVTGPNPIAYDPAGRFVLKLDCGQHYTWTTGPMRVGDKAGYSVPNGISCETSVVSRPNPNSSYVWRGETYSLGKTFITRDMNEDGTVTHNLQRDDVDTPIPALDLKALLMLIGLLSGWVFWQRKREKQRG